jgi:hypothetical protein
VECRASSVLLDFFYVLMPWGQWRQPIGLMGVGLNLPKLLCWARVVVQYGSSFFATRFGGSLRGLQFRGLVSYPSVETVMLESMQSVPVPTATSHIDC